MSNGNMMASGSGDSTIKIWDISDLVPRLAGISSSNNNSESLIADSDSDGCVYIGGECYVKKTSLLLSNMDETVIKNDIVLSETPIINYKHILYSNDIRHGLFKKCSCNIKTLDCICRFQDNSTYY